jgi:predicted transcriptional regulator
LSQETSVGRVPSLSRFELQVLRILGSRGESSVRDLHASLETAPSYSTVRKIVERLESKGAVVRVRRQGAAWIYRSAVRPSAMIRHEVRRLLDSLFDGSAMPLVSHLLETKEVSLEDLRELERARKRSRKP